MTRYRSHSMHYLLQVLDICLIALSWYLAYWFRFYYLPHGQIGVGELFFKLSPLIIITSVYFLIKNDLYKIPHKGYKIIPVLKANSLSMITIVILLYFFAEDRLSRIVLLSHFTLSSFLLILSRVLAKKIIHYLHRKGKRLTHVLLIGDGKQMETYINTIRNPHLGIKITAWIDSGELASKYQIPSLSYSSLSPLKQDIKSDMIIIGYSTEKSHKMEHFLNKNYNNIAPIKILPDISYSLIGHHIENFEGIPVLNINTPRISFIDMILKRSFDIFVSFFSLLILSPLMILISILIKLDSKGPVFYVQKRIGMDGTSFNMWKFRTMTNALNNEDQITWSSKNESRKTNLGIFLRKTSLDELPQLLNVLIGNMSLVGPRPERPYFVQKFHEEIPAYMLRHKVKVGITGWAQINGWRGDTCLKNRIEHDLYYIKNWSLLLDIKIIMLTLIGSLKHKNAY